MSGTAIEGILTFSSIVSLASLILFALTVDRLIRILHESYRDDWSDLGRPVGILYIPEGADWRQGIVALLSLVCDVLVKTPGWLADKPNLRFLVTKIRWCIALIAASVLTGVGLQWVSSPH
jgi:hypothetical protein